MHKYPNNEASLMPDVKRFGDTNISGHASVQLGDRINTINLAGDVHIHVNAPLEVITAATVAFRAATLSRQLLDLCLVVMRNSKTSKLTTESESLTRLRKLLAFDTFSRSLLFLSKKWQERPLRSDEDVSNESSSLVGVRLTGQSTLAITPY